MESWILITKEKEMENKDSLSDGTLGLSFLPKLLSFHVCWYSPQLIICKTHHILGDFSFKKTVCSCTRENDSAFLSLLHETTI